MDFRLTAENLLRSFVPLCIARDCQPYECPGVCLARVDALEAALRKAAGEAPSPPEPAA
jgi:hypothetical protein